MVIKPLFMDSGGFYELVSVDSPAHKKAVRIMEDAFRVHRLAITTDYIIDETATLLRARGLGNQLTEFFELIETSQALTVEWTTPDRFASARQMMLKHLDQDFSFTDCVSFVVMKELRLNDALVTDRHFRTAGFNPLLAV